MIYLASPYSHPLRRVRQMRFETARSYVASRLQQGAVIFSPIVYLHDIAEQYYFPKDAVFWKNFNFAFLKGCEQLCVLKLDGWAVSVGVKMEMDFAVKSLIPIEFVEWHE